MDINKQYKNISKKILAIDDPNNLALKYITKKINSNNYRNVPSPEQNGQNVDQVWKFLSVLNKKKYKMLPIPPGDDDGRMTSRDFPLYVEFKTEVEKKLGKMTKNSIKKNYGVDLHRGGLITRFDKNKLETDPFKRSIVYYFQITQDGKKFAKEKNKIKRDKHYELYTERLIGDLKEDVEKILSDKNGINYLTFHEVMFFVISMRDNDENLFLDYNQCIELLVSYRKLSKHARTNEIHDILSTSLKPSNFENVTKTYKRDYDNWVNKINHIFEKLDFGSTFNIVDKEKGNAFQKIQYASTSKTKKQIDRDKNERKKYFEKHFNKNEKKLKTDNPNLKAFELDHIVPIKDGKRMEPAYQKNIENYKNLLFISADKHKIKSVQRSKFKILEKLENNDLMYKSFDGECLILKFKENVLYNPKLIDDMLSHNKELLDWH